MSKEEIALEVSSVIDLIIYKVITRSRAKLYYHNNKEKIAHFVIYEIQEIQEMIILQTLYEHELFQHRFVKHFKSQHNYYIFSIRIINITIKTSSCSIPLII